MLWRVLEVSPPQIVVVEMPRGIGLAPVSVRLEISDNDSGLDEVVVRTSQKGTRKELLREFLGGRNHYELAVDFPGSRSDLEEGVAALEIKAFDRSLWSNAAETSVRLDVDFRKPKIEVLSTQHNCRQGGSQLVFYKAFDENLVLSGVKVGNQTFPGYPARGIDSSIEDPAVYVALYAVDLEQRSAELAVRAFAEDVVGNATSTTFYNKIQPRDVRKINTRLSEEFLRERTQALVDSNRERLRAAGIEPDYKTPRGGIERLIEEFSILNGPLRDLNKREVATQLNQAPRFDRYWEPQFLQPSATVEGLFGDLVSYYYDDAPVGTTLRQGYEFSLDRGSSEVYAVNKGIVAFSDNIGVFGRVVAIDHGLGLNTLYGFLDHVSVSRGDAVEAGQKIGVAGQSGLAQGTKLYFEMRVQGVPVDPREWWDKRWYYSHITAKINEVKRSLGIPVYRPLG